MPERISSLCLQVVLVSFPLRVEIFGFEFIDSCILAAISSLAPRFSRHFSSYFPPITRKANRLSAAYCSEPNQIFSEKQALITHIRIHKLTLPQPAAEALWAKRG
jgi:hypothetical protein